MVFVLGAGACAAPAHLDAVRPVAPAPVASMGPIATTNLVPVAPPPPADAAVEAPRLGWVELVRLERWEEARDALNALPEQDARRPEMRLVRARIDAALGEREAAIALLEGLERELPELAETVLHVREAAWATRDARGGGKGTRAGKARRPRKPEELLVAAEQTARSVSLERALDEVAAVAARKDAPSKARLALARARVLYAARRYGESGAAFDALVASGSGDRAEALFYAARSRSREGRDDEAEARYLDLAKRFPRSRWAEEATFLRARLAWLHGRFAEACERYDAYTRAWPRGRFLGVARYERAVALLAAGRHEPARKELAALVARASGDAERARLAELEAAARFGAGDREGAIRSWTKIAEAQPLSWPGLASRARLLREGVQPPPLAPSDEGARTPPVPELPEAARKLHELGLDGEAEAWLSRHDRKLLGRASGASLCRLYEPIDRAKRRFRIGAPAVPGAMLARAPSTATEWAWRCAFPRPFADAVTDLERREQLPAGLVHAIMRQESGFDPRVVSPARAVGLLQLLPETARRVAEEAEVPFAPERLDAVGANLDLGARYLGKMMRVFGGSVPLAAAAYNAGPRAVATWLDNTGDLDLDVWVARIPYDETRGYVAHVMSNLARYAYLDEGDASLAQLDLSMPRETRLELALY